MHVSGSDKASSRVYIEAKAEQGKRIQMPLTTKQDSSFLIDFKVVKEHHFDDDQTNLLAPSNNVSIFLDIKPRCDVEFMRYLRHYPRIINAHAQEDHGAIFSQIIAYVVLDSFGRIFDVEMDIKPEGPKKMYHLDHKNESWYEASQTSSLSFHAASTFDKSNTWNFVAFPVDTSHLKTGYIALELVQNGFNAELYTARVAVSTKVKTSDEEEACSYHEVRLPFDSDLMCIKVLYPAEVNIYFVDDVRDEYEFSPQDYTLPGGSNTHAIFCREQGLWDRL